MNRSVFSLLALVGFSFSVFAASLPEWPRFRGPNGSGAGAALNLPEKVSDADVLWKAELPGAGHSSPAIAGDRVFLTTADKTTGNRVLVCVSAKDGKISWTKSFDGPVFREHADNSFASATPAVDDQRVYLCSFSPEGSWLAAFAQEDGAQLWTKELGKFASQHGPGASPLVWEDLVIVDFDQDQPKSYISAFDSKTGVDRWRWEKAGTKHSSSTPCIFTPKKGAPQVITQSFSVGVAGLDARTGKQVWSLPGLLTKRCVSSPIVTSDGLIVAQCGEGQAESFVYAVRVSDDGQTAEKAYEVVRVGGYVPTPIAVGDFLFLWKENGLVTCLRASNNEQVWSERVQGPFYGSPIAVGGRLYNVTRKGELVVLGAGDKFQEVARFNLGEGSHATPAVAGGRMYVRTFSHLVALGGK
ncbi:MAG TPA: PQQ-binding-like beta-propeller repeat protein [Chthoniobacteraceae bacterium]|nr:PQQ-binding-like beta-propeller repeat protein [Chthoniobacteraceae bacterium]